MTREPERAAGVLERLERLGARVEARAAIAFEGPRDESSSAAAIAHLSRYDWLVFSSPTGARFFSARLRAAGVEAPAVAARIAAIGPATGKALAALGLRPGITVTESHARGLARALRSRVRSGERVLVVRPEVASPEVPDALRDAGAEVDAVAFYRTVASAGAAEVARRIACGAYDAVVMTSPSNWRCLGEAGAAEGVALSQGLARARRVAIGPTTAAAMADAGMAAHAVAAAPDDDGIVSAVLDALGA